MKFNAGDRVRVTSTPYNDALPNGSEGTVTLNLGPMPASVRSMMGLIGMHLPEGEVDGLFVRIDDNQFNGPDGFALNSSQVELVETPVAA